GDARAIILTGSDRVFCAGAHLGELAATVDDDEAARIADAARLADLYAAVLRAPIVTIAAVRGAAYGGGAGLAAACDFVIAAPTATFQFSELRLGFVPALISVFLPRRMAPAPLARMVLDPHPLDGATARAAGLVDELADDPLAVALITAERIARRCAPGAIAVTKRLLLETALPDLDARLAAAARLNAGQRTTVECRAGVAHFLASRTFPDWLADECSRTVEVDAAVSSRLDTPEAGT
ncbi:MAG: enoyl-CoA hydratase/isomerase family protein, partial [Acidobacteria bacterium]|nr:enoyl-CoA hydratase/isomerase family protein [Acidobacteriota bacterium]